MPHSQFATSIDKSFSGTQARVVKIDVLRKVHTMESVKNMNNIITCAACGKEESGDAILKSCTACKSVKYCNRDCQIAHRPQHKKACKKRAIELHDEALFKDPGPPDECPICFLPLPNIPEQNIFESCCGKVMCNGCIHAMTLEEYRRRLAAAGGQRLASQTIAFDCAFCRSPNANSPEEHNLRMTRLVEKDNADAICRLADDYKDGTNGNTQSWAKARELWQRAGELGNARAYYNLGIFYNDMAIGMERDEKKAKHYFELAAMMGSLDARYNLANSEARTGNYHRASKHYAIAARAGDKDALERVKELFLDGYITKDGYEIALRAYQSRQYEMKSDMRDKAARFKAALQRGVPVRTALAQSETS